MTDSNTLVKDLNNSRVIFNKNHAFSSKEEITPLTEEAINKIVF